MLQNREHSGDRASEISGVEGHGYVNDGGVVGTLGQRRPHRPGAFHAVPKCRCLTKRREISGRHSGRKMTSDEEDQEDCEGRER